MLANTSSNAPAVTVMGPALDGAWGAAVSRALLDSNFNMNVLRDWKSNSTLRKDEFELYDTAVVNSREKLQGAAALIVSAGLTFNLPNPLGHLVLTWDRVSSMQPAEKVMDPSVPGTADRVDFDPQSVPIWCAIKPFHLDIRTLNASRNLGTPLDTLQSELATLKVNEAIQEAVLIGGPSYAGADSYGLLNHPSRNVGSLAGDWSTVGVTGEQILGDVLLMIAALKAERFRGPYGLVIPDNYHNKLQQDFKANSDKTIMARLMEVDDLQSIVVDDDIDAAVVMVNLSRDVVDIVDGLPPTLVTWDEQGGLRMSMKVMAIEVPRVRDLYNGDMGVAHYSE